MASKLNRRAFVASSVVASAGAALALGAASSSARGADNPTAQQAAAAPQGVMPMGKIGDMKINRLVLGGSPLQHYVHARDLDFIRSLLAHYNTPERILQTLALAEQQGINTVVAHPSGPAGNTLALLKQHREKHGGKMQWILAPMDPIEPGLAKYGQQVQKLVDNGADAIYVWGVQSDGLVNQGKIDLLGKAVDLIKSYGVPCGVGGHTLPVVEQCEKHGIHADFYVKTFHHLDYPSAKLNFDSCWCPNPEETIKVMEEVKKPWIAFKVLAAGAILPQDGFRYAFENGADFVLAGMYDFELAQDARIASDIVASLKQRKRPWRA